MRVVRSVGQAFEDCNKNQQLSPTSPHPVFEYDGLETNETNFDNGGYDEQQQQQCDNEFHQQSNNRT